MSTTDLPQKKKKHSSEKKKMHPAVGILKHKWNDKSPSEIKKQIRDRVWGKS